MSQGTKATGVSDAARKRAAMEMIARYETALKRTALRYSISPEDAEDAYQRALEIALTKAPTTELRELVRWTQTVTKHEALAVRQGREKLLGRQPQRAHADHDPVAAIPARAAAPDEQVERREAVARSREALRTLKPAELKALGLLAEGYSYAEIGAMTGYSPTKVNRVLAEGRARFRTLLARSEEGERCRELAPLLSAFCDGEAAQRDAATVREHLRACARCRATARTYRAAPRMAAALLPLLPSSRSLLGRAHDFATSLASRLPGPGGGSVATQVAAAGGGRGAGMAALAKLLATSAGVAGGAAACMATGVLPTPALVSEQPAKPAVERPAPAAPAAEEPAAGQETVPPRKEEPKPKHEAPAPEASPESAGAVEYEAPPPAPEPAPASTASPPEPSTGSAAGEFGP